MTEFQDAPTASADDHKFTLRLPEDILSPLEANRKRESRSLNSEILLRLQRTFDQDRAVADQSMRTHLGLIEFLAGCVEELAGLLPEEQREDTKVQLMVELSRGILRPRD